MPLQPWGGTSVYLLCTDEGHLLTTKRFDLLWYLLAARYGNLRAKSMHVRFCFILGASLWWLSRPAVGQFACAKILL